MDFQDLVWEMVCHRLRHIVLGEAERAQTVHVDRINELSMEKYENKTQQCDLHTNNTHSTITRCPRSGGKNKFQQNEIHTFCQCVNSTFNTHHDSPAHTVSFVERQYVAIVGKCDNPLAGDFIALGIEPSLLK